MNSNSGWMAALFLLWANATQLVWGVTQVIACGGRCFFPINVNTSSEKLFLFLHSLYVCAFYWLPTSHIMMSMCLLYVLFETEMKKMSQWLYWNSLWEFVYITIQDIVKWLEGWKEYLHSGYRTDQIYWIRKKKESFLRNFFLPSLQSLLSYQKFIFPVIKLLPFLECVGCFMHSNSLQRTTASNSKDEGDLTEMHLFGTSKNCTFYFYKKLMVLFHFL